MKKALVYLKHKKIAQICVADTFLSRFMGLMGKTPMQIEGMGALLIKPCSQIHMFFMKTPIDVVYLNKANEIVKIDREVPTGICCKKVKEAHCVIEFPSGSAEKINVKIGDKLEVYNDGR